MNKNLAFEYNELQKRIDKAIDLNERIIKEYKMNYGNTPSKLLSALETQLEILKVENNNLVEKEGKL